MAASTQAHAPVAVMTNGAAHSGVTATAPASPRPIPPALDLSDQAAQRIMEELRGGANPSPVAALAIELAAIANVRAQQLNAIGGHVQALQQANAELRQQLAAREVPVLSGAKSAGAESGAAASGDGKAE